MSIRTLRRHATFGVAVAALSLLALGACGDDDSSDSSASPGTTAPAITVDEELAALLPESVRNGGLEVGADASYPPNEYSEGGEIVGWTVDLGNAIGEVLGVDVNFVNSPFDGILPGIQSKKYNLGMSSFTANAERQEVVNFATYFSAGTQWATRTGNPEGVEPDSACGKTIAVQRGTVQVDDIQARSKECTDAGNDAIEISQFQLQTDATNAVVNQRADAMLADSPITGYAVKTASGLELLGDVYDSAPYGIAVPCNGDGTACADPYTDQPEEFANYVTAIQGAIQSLIDGGQYEAILTEWGVESGAIETSEINPA